MSDKAEDSDVDMISDDSETAAIIRPTSNTTSQTKEPDLSLVRVIFKHYAPLLFVGFLCKFIADWLKFVDPLLQG